VFGVASTMAVKPDATHPGLLATICLIGEFVADQQRRDLEEVFVIVDVAKLARWTVPEHCACRGHRMAAAPGASSVTVAGSMRMSKTSATTCDQPWTKYLHPSSRTSSRSACRAFAWFRNFDDPR
jgi:hypothetical protein